ncbi:YkvA family protein [Bacillus sp. 1780r2a1]|nr:YkvA family protein [Bacillus sp. 1780r2a1]
MEGLNINEKTKCNNKIKELCKKLKQNLFVLFLSYKDKSVPLYAKVVAICVVAYAFSPVNLIPDFIPVLGYLDDLIIVPIGISLALKLIPSHIIESYQLQAEELKKNKRPKNWFVGFLIVLIWITFLVWIIKVMYELLK